MKALRWYNARLVQRPLLTKCATGMVLFGMGDVLSQTVEAWTREKRLREVFEKKRCANLSVFGALYLSPLLHYWYGFLAKRFPGRGVTPTIKKLALDQTLFSNVIILSFFIVVTRMNGGTLKDGLNKVKEQHLNALLMNWRIWPTVMLMTFCMVSVRYHVLFVNGVAVFWNAYLSYLTNLKI